MENINIKLATENGFELDWLINRWDSIIKDNKFKNLAMMTFMLNLNVEKQINLLNNPT